MSCARRVGAVYSGEWCRSHAHVWQLMQPSTRGGQGINMQRFDHELQQFGGRLPIDVLASVSCAR